MTFPKGDGKETLLLRLGFLLPLVGVLLVTVLVMVFFIRRHTEADIETDARHAASRVEHLYQDEIDASAAMLGAAMEVLSTDQTLRQALAQRDRARLLQRSLPLFAELKKKYAITHFYFSDSNRVNILRVHKPARFGDTIGRATTLEAQRNRQTSYGVELGPLGTFTLRLVTPWFGAHGRPLGFVELGMEIDHVLRTVQHASGARIYVLISKQFLDRGEWEASMRAQGRAPDWDRFPEVVVNNQATRDISAELTRSLREHLKSAQKIMAPLTEGTTVYRAVFLPLRDAAGKSVGKMVLLVNVSAQIGAVRSLTRKSSAVGAVAGLTLLGLFYWLLGLVGRRLERHEKSLRELASRDGLTGLYNHRMYYVKLEEEFTRRRRTELPVSVLLLDIDHFKQINDRYGHLAGDTVLKSLSELLLRLCRAMDIACRYGGEELTVILPETGAEGAREFAERLREAVESHHFELEGGKAGHVTVSVGVATSSDTLHSPKDVTESADRALYRAKESGRNKVCVT